MPSRRNAGLKIVLIITRKGAPSRGFDRYGTANLELSQANRRGLGRSSQRAGLRLAEGSDKAVWIRNRRRVDFLPSPPWRSCRTSRDQRRGQNHPFEDDVHLACPYNRPNRN